MRVLGLDPSTCTGYCVSEGRKILEAGKITFPKLKGLERVQAIAGRVFQVIETYKPDAIVIESRIVGRSSTCIVTIEIASVLRYFLWQEGFKYLEVNPTSLKKFIAGNGNAKKEEVMMHVLKNFDHTSKDNNEADAVAISMLGQVIYGGVQVLATMRKQAEHIAKTETWPENWRDIPEKLCN